MADYHPRLVKEQGRDCILIPLSEWQEIQDQLEELDDIRAYDAVKLRLQSGTEELLPLEQVKLRLEKGLD